MDARIPKKSVFKFFLLSIITLGIYAIVFWHKLGKNVNALCEGDGKRTMKYGLYILKMDTIHNRMFLKNYLMYLYIYLLIHLQILNTFFLFLQTCFQCCFLKL